MLMQGKWLPDEIQIDGWQLTPDTLRLLQQKGHKLGMLLIYHQPLRTRKAPFDHPDWIFELKYDGFRALACIENRRYRFVSRNRHQFSSFSDLERAIETATAGKTILDGELACVDDECRRSSKICCSDAVTLASLPLVY